MKYLSILLCSHLFASNMLSFDEIQLIKSGNKKVTSPRRQKDKSLEVELAKTKKLLESYRYVNKMQLKDPIILRDVLINELQSIAGVTEKAVMATNSPNRIVIKDLRGVDLPENSKISCEIIAKYKRVCGKCTRLVIGSNAYDIDADLQNRDGSRCVIGKLYDGKEKYATGILLGALAQGAISLGQTSIATVGGNLIENTANNQLKQSVLNAGGEMTELMKEEYKTSESIVTIKRNTDVIIQFNKKVEL